MNHAAAIVTFKAKLGKGKKVAELIADALPKALRESPMPVWLVLQSETNPDMVYIVDLFVDKTGRDDHLNDEAARQIMATVPEYLLEPINIEEVNVIASKVVA